MAEEMIVKLRGRAEEIAVLEVPIFAYFTQQDNVGMDGINVVIPQGTLVFERVEHEETANRRTYYIRVDLGDGEDYARHGWLHKRFAIGFVEPERISIPTPLACPSVHWRVHRVDIDADRKTRAIYLRSRVREPKASK